VSDHIKTTISIMRASRLRSACPTPSGWGLLNDQDKAEYRQFRKRIDPLTIRTSREKLGVQFQTIISQIQKYSIRNDSNDWKRCFTCGVAWLDRGLAVSTRQLCRLLGKCKSSINAGFLAMGYSTFPMDTEDASQLMAFFPFLIENSSEVRQWTIRSPADCRPRTATPSIDDGSPTRGFQERDSLEEEDDGLFEFDDSPEWPPMNDQA
jgi:hypothetical protein